MALHGTTQPGNSGSLSIEELLLHPELRSQLWRAGDPAAAAACITTGFAALDRVLGGGWPLGQLTEFLTDAYGIGEFSLLVPALRDGLCHGARQGWVMLVGPPYIPYAPALRTRGLDLSRLLLVRTAGQQVDVLWAMEQALRSGTCNAVIGWATADDERALRRLQLAAESGGTWAALFRPLRFRVNPSPAGLRIQLRAGDRGVLNLHVLKQRGRAGEEVEVDPVNA